MTVTPTTAAMETLSRLSQLAGQQFESMDDATEAILETITSVLGMRTSWVSRADHDACELHIDAAHNEPGGSEVAPGGSAPLDVTFCNLIISARQPAPLIIEDVRNDALYADSVAARAFPTIGSYVGVPIILSDGSIHGTLCASDPEPVQVTANQAQLLSVLSRLLATQIERDRELESRHRIENRFHAFMDNSPALAYMKDQEGRYVYANRLWYEAFKREPNWIIGKTDFDYLDPATAQTVQEEDRSVLSSQAVESFHESSLEPGGDVRHWYSIKFPVKGGDDEVLLGGVSVDITERHEQEVQRALLAAIVQDTQDAVYAKTLEGVITAWNPAAERLYGYSANEMIGNTLDVIIPPGMPNDLVEINQRLQQGERIAQYETFRRARDGRILHVELTLSLIRDGSGNVSGVSTIARDITEHMRLIAERDRLYTELQAEVARAAEIQAHLLPTTVPFLGGFEFAAVCQPAREVGGDFFDWAENGAAIRMTLGDVTGKGMAAALLMATTRAALRGAANETIDDAMTTVNRALMDDLGHSDAFVTMFHADLHADGRLTYTDAGHGLALIIRRDGTVEQLAHRQPPIGIADTRYKSTNTRIEEGDMLIVYSDGLPDARPDLKLDIPENVAGMCVSCGDVNQLIDSLVQAASSTGPRIDDLTVIAVHRKERAA